MNKVFLGLILTVCILGMALVMLNDRLGRKSEPRQVATAVETQAPPASPAEIEANARAVQIAEAAGALAQGPQNPVPDPEPQLAPQPPAPIIEVHNPVKSQPELTPPEAAPGEAADRPAMPPAVPVKPEIQEAKPVTEVKPAAQETRSAVKPATEPRPVQNAVASGEHAITRFVIYARDKGATVRLGANGKLDYSSMNLTNPDRIVVDLPGSWKFPAHPGVPKNELVSAVRIGQQGDKTRVVIDLKQPARKILLVPFRNGDGVDVRVDK